MLLAVYNALISVLWPLLYLYPPFRGTIRARLGHFELGSYDPAAPGLKVLVNAVSAGEVVAISSFIRELKRRRPDCQVVLLTTTDSGQEMARQKLADAVSLACYFPLADLPFVVKRYLDKLRPELYISCESELWPNIQSQCRRRGIPVALVNARLYLHNKTGLRGAVVRGLYQLCDLIVCQDEDQRGNFLKFGLPDQVLAVSGNTKFDFEVEAWDEWRLAQWRELFALDPQQPVLVAGSTHPGEEALIFSAVQELRGRGMHLQLVLAPRHIERISEVQQSALQAGFRPRLLSQLQAPEEHHASLGAHHRHDLVLVDRYGVLLDCYRLADLVLMGGTFHPKVGGHNILEATILGKPVLAGPHVYSILAQTAMLERAEALLRADCDISSADGPAALASALQTPLQHPARSAELGERARKLTLANQGSAKRAVDAVLKLIR
ncbi:hypothetical protein IT575_10005 [bacterium]|nr:hypothetical protein [bacterium]